MKKSILPVFPILVLLLLLLFPSISFEGAKNGLLLWFNVVLPTLLPFMLCSGVIVAWGGVRYLTRPLMPLFRLFHLSEAGGYTWLCGLLCGYPMGAKTAADFVKSGELSPAEGKRLLSMAGCPSPMFLTGYVRACLPFSFPFIYIPAAMYLPVMVIAYVSRFIYKESICTQDNNRNHKRSQTVVSDCISRPFDTLLMDALEIMVKIGGYIMIFSILALFADRLFPAGFTFKPVLLGFIEMTTGIQAISVSSMERIPAAAAIAAAAAFGGLSGVFQTNTVIKNAGLSIRHYVLWKLLHAVLTGILLILLIR